MKASKKKVNSKKVDDTIEELLKQEEKEEEKVEEEEIEIIECPGVDGARNRNPKGLRGFNAGFAR